MRSSSIHLALGLMLGPAAALALDVQDSIDIAAPADEVWALVGEFCAIQEWHPQVETCTVDDDATTVYRTFTTRDGATYRDQLMDSMAGERVYSYSPVESPLPILGGIAQFEVTNASDGNSVVVWQAEFSTLSSDDASAEDPLQEFLREGLQGIAAHFE